MNRQQNDTGEVASSIQRIALNELPDNSARANTPPMFRGHLELIRNVRVRLEIVVGETELTVGELMDLKKDSVVRLDRTLDQPLDIMLDGKLIGKGELVAADDNFGIRITELSPFE